MRDKPLAPCRSQKVREWRQPWIVWTDLPLEIGQRDVAKRGGVHLTLKKALTSHAQASFSASGVAAFCRKLQVTLAEKVETVCVFSGGRC